MFDFIFVVENFVLTFFVVTPFGIRRIIDDVFLIIMKNY